MSDDLTPPGDPEPSVPPPVDPVSPQPGQVPPPPPYSGGGNRFPVRGCLIAFAIAFVLGLGGCVAFGYFVFNATRGPVDSTNEFMKAYKTHNTEQISKLSCAGSNPEGDLNLKIGLVDVKTYRFYASNVNNSNGTVTGTITQSNGRSHPVTVQLEKNDGWRVCSISSGILRDNSFSDLRDSFSTSTSVF